MNIAVAINCDNFDCVAEKIEKTKSFLAEGDWLHLDVADGRFTFNKTWADSKRWKELGVTYPLEVHLMVEEPEKFIDEWIEAGAKRIIVHLESIAGYPVPRPVSVRAMDTLRDIIKKCANKNVSVMIAINPETLLEGIGECLENFSEFLVLAVHPGLSGQKFLPLVLEKVRFLRRNFPQSRIELDGGINLENAQRAKEAGVDIIASGSYIFWSDNPAEAYQKLKKI